MALNTIKGPLIGDGSVTSADLDNTGVTAGSYGSSSQVPVITVDAKGRITAASQTAVAGVSNVTYDAASGVLTITTSDGGSYTVDMNVGTSDTPTLTGLILDGANPSLQFHPGAVDDWKIQMDDTSKEMDFVYNGGIKATLTSGGALTTNSLSTGNITVTGTVDGRDVAADGTKLDGIESGADVTDAANVEPLVDTHLNTSTATSGEYLSWNGSDYNWSTVDLTTKVSKSGDTMTGNLAFGDNVKAVFGAGSDLEVYSSGSNGVLYAPGYMFLKGATGTVIENPATFGSIIEALPHTVKLSANGSYKLVTNTNGVDVTGNLSVTGNITSGGDVGIGTSTPTAKLHVDAPNTTTPSLTWGATAGQILTNEDSEFAFGLDSTAPYALYIQGRYTANTARDITLNPLGGYIGIGKRDPTATLDVNGGAANHVIARFFQNNASYNTDISIGHVSTPTDNTLLTKRADGDLWLYHGTNKNIEIHTNGTQRFEVTGGGVVATKNGSYFQGHIHDTTGNGDANQPFRFSTDYSGWAQIFSSDWTNNNGWGTFWAGNDGAAYQYFGSTNPNEYVFVGGGVARASIDLDNGNAWFAGEILAASDERLKSEINPITDALDIVLALEGKKYIKDNKPQIGLIAQQVESILPEVVTTSGGVDGLKSVNYGNIVAVLIEAIKEQQTQIDELKKLLENK